MKKEEKKKSGAQSAKNLPGRTRGAESAVPGINTPGIELPAFNPPVPNRAWTAMREGMDIDSLSPEEKADLYLGKDNCF